MKYYKKWRDLIIDPFKIKYKKISLEKILSYLPAGNDVLLCKCKYNNREEDLFIKIERSKMANFKVEVEILDFLKDTKLKKIIPKLIEYGKVNDKYFLVTKTIEGERLSEILKKDSSMKKEYLKKYGRTLGNIHKIPLSAKIPSAMQRVINDYPKEEIYTMYNFDDFIKKEIAYLIKTKPDFNFNTFIHGDFHYANILWENKEITGILDFEYSGKGFKEQDIAWSLVLRPTQQFLDNFEDIKYFLDGYKEENTYNKEALKWCFINACCHFYIMNNENNSYKTKLSKLIEEAKKYKF